MPLPPLDRLLKTGGLKMEPPVLSELRSLIRSSEARLKDAQNKSLELESRFDLVADVDEQLVSAMIRIAGEVHKRVLALMP